MSNDKTTKEQADKLWRMMFAESGVSGLGLLESYRAALKAEIEKSSDLTFCQKEKVLDLIDTTLPLK